MPDTPEEDLAWARQKGLSYLINARDVAYIQASTARDECRQELMDAGLKAARLIDVLVREATDRKREAFVALVLEAMIDASVMTQEKHYHPDPELRKVLEARAVALVEEFEKTKGGSAT